LLLLLLLLLPLPMMLLLLTDIDVVTKPVTMWSVTQTTPRDHDETAIRDKKLSHIWSELYIGISSKSYYPDPHTLQARIQIAIIHTSIGASSVCPKVWPQKAIVLQHGWQLFVVGFKEARNNSTRFVPHQVQCPSPIPIHSTHRWNICHDIWWIFSQFQEVRDVV